MKIYLDVSCLNRPFDDQPQVRIRLEAEAVMLILERFETGEWEPVSSEMTTIETDAMPDEDRHARVRLLLPEEPRILKLTPAVWDRAPEMERFGFKSADAVHVAAAEWAGADAHLSCDDRLVRVAKRNRHHLRTRVANPVEWLKEVDRAPNA